VRPARTFSAGAAKSALIPPPERPTTTTPSPAPTRTVLSGAGNRVAIAPVDLHDEERAARTLLDFLDGQTGERALLGHDHDFDDEP